MKFTNACRTHDLDKRDTEMAFYPIYTAMFVLSVGLNSILLYIVVKKDKFIHEKRSFHKLFQILISLDLIISILILPNILIKGFSEDEDTFSVLDAYLGIRDFAISVQMFTLILIAIDRLLAFLLPLSNFWRVNTVSMVLYSCMAVLGVLYSTRFILFRVPIACTWQIKIDENVKLTIGISGVILMLITFGIYVVLFGLLCQRQIVRHRNSFSSNIHFNVQKTEDSSEIEDIKLQNKDMKRSISLKDRVASLMSTQKRKISRRTGSIKFVKVLFGVNLLMIISYLPALMYNSGLIGFPYYSVYYLFFLHALGDPILFILTRKEMKKNFVEVFRCKRN